MNEDDEDIELPDIELGEIRDGVVSERTMVSYVAEIFNFFVWVRFHQPDVLTEACKNILALYEDEFPDVQPNKLYAKVKGRFQLQLRGSDTVPLIVEGALSANTYMNYIRTLRNKKTGNYLSRSAYGVKRSALFHLYRLHNGNGYPEAFKLKLSNLFKGFYRVMVQRRRQACIPEANNSTANPPPPDGAPPDAGTQLNPAVPKLLNIARNRKFLFCLIFVLKIILIFFQFLMKRRSQCRSNFSSLFANGSF
jgi:hypothetical protein